MATVLDVTESLEVDSELARLAGEQAALRRVATLVAREAPQIEVFAEIAQGIGQLLGAEEIRMFRYEDNRTAMVVAAAGEDADLVPVGASHPLGGDNATSRVFTTRQPARIDNYETATGQIGDVVREGGIRAVVATPIMVEGRLWGALVTATTRDEPLPPDTESRMSQFTELMATAIANTESRAEVERLADEQAALRRVATLIARESSPVDVFGDVVEEAARVLGTEAVGMLRFEPGGTATLVAQSATPWDPPPIGTSFTLEGENLIAAVYRTGKVARTDDWGNATGSVAAMASVLGVRSSVATPIVVEGRLWGTMIAATSQREPLPADTESRTAQFTELLGTAIANAQARGEVERLANEQAAMRRVATLVAQGIPPTEVFPAVAAEVSVLFGSDVSAIVRFENDGTVTVLGDVGGPHEAGARVTLDRGYVVHTVRETRRSARFDTDDPPAADTGSLVRSLGVRSAVASPIIVEGELWGAITAASLHGPLSPNAERRLTQFTELVATAVANSDARAEVIALADEQAALRRVATLVAKESPPAEVFGAVAEEVRQLFGDSLIYMFRYQEDRAVVVVASAGIPEGLLAVGSRIGLGGNNAATRISRTGKPARIDDYATASGPLAEAIRPTGTRAVVGTPLIIYGRLWGAMVVGTTAEDSLPPETERRLGQFTELLATAIANAEARAELIASRARLVTAADEARRSFERDLHDGIQQRLVSISFELRGAEAMATSENEELMQHLSNVGVRLTEALDALRELSRGIHPAILSEGGLAPALKALARRSHVPVKLDLAVDRRLADPIEIGAYYVVSEALTNAAKHASASTVEVRASALDGVLELTIDDDGVGGADPRHGSGLTGLADRVETLGGTISIASPSGGGTSLRVKLPLDGQ